MRIRIAASIIVATVSVVMGACGGSPTTPPTVNTPPTIESLVIAGDRAEADQPIQINATVKDAETPISQLTYAWSASPQNGTFGGTTTFNGSQALMTWRPPKGQTTPNVYTITLTVSEAYSSAGQAKLNLVSSSVQVHYNDSVAELTNLGYDFIVTKFGNYSVSPQECVSNFSDSCPGKAAELSDITVNREIFQILAGTFGPNPSVTFDSDKTHATVVNPCVFFDIVKASGVRERVSAICTLTGVYENFKWFLCDSHAGPGPGGTTPLSMLRGRVPGRVVPF
jgi:hypothetical protein